jgi:hypothetical protein
MQLVQFSRERRQGIRWIQRQREKRADAWDFPGSTLANERRRQAEKKEKEER